MSGARLLVDGGGTTTRAALWCHGKLSQPRDGASCNPRSVGQERALANLDKLLRLVWHERAPDVNSLEAVWLCLSTASSRAALEEFASALRVRVSGPLRDAGDLWITNDIAPLMVHDGRVTERVAAICGTGTGFCAINPPQALCARASGQEYLLTDEGGGFDLGLRGLRAIVRANDGRGPETSLSDALASWQGVSTDDLFDLVYSSAEPKILIASLAPFVLVAAEQGDRCARLIVDYAVQEIMEGIRATTTRARLDRPYEVVLAGSNLVGEHGFLRERVQACLYTSIPDVTISVITASTLKAVAQLAEILPRNPSLRASLEATLPLARHSLSTRKPEETLDGAR